MSAPTTPAPPAGWYADPWAAGALRYFDGIQWTVQTAPFPSGPPLPVGPHPMPTAAQAAPLVDRHQASAHGTGSPIGLWESLLAGQPGPTTAVLVAVAAVLAAVVGVAFLTL